MTKIHVGHYKAVVFVRGRGLCLYVVRVTSEEHFQLVKKLRVNSPPQFELFINEIVNKLSVSSFFMMPSEKTDRYASFFLQSL